jgi:hypothetical protein
MTAVALGQRDQTGAVEIDAVVMDEIRVLPFVLAARPEPDLAVILVDPVDPADDPVAFGDRILDAALRAIDQVQVPPAVHLGDVDDLVRLGQVVDRRILRRWREDVLDVSGPDEGFGLLVDDRAVVAGDRVDFDQSEPLMSAVDLLVSEVPAVFLPPQPRRRVAVPLEVDPVDFRLGLFPVGDREQVQLVRGELVARQGVRPRLELRPPALLGRRLDQMDLLAVARLDAEGDEILGVRGPLQQAVGESFLSVLAQLDFLAAVGRLDIGVGILDLGRPLLVRRLDRSRSETPATLSGPALRLGLALAAPLAALLRRRRVVGLRTAEPGGLEAGEFVILVRRFLARCCRDRGGRLRVGLGARVVRQVARPDRVADLELDVALVGEFDGVERQLVGLVFLAGGRRQTRRELRVVERRAALAPGGVDDEELPRAALEFVVVPEAGVVREPVGGKLRLVNARHLSPPAAAELPGLGVRLREVLPRRCEALQRGILLGRRLRAEPRRTDRDGEQQSGGREQNRLCLAHGSVPAGEWKMDRSYWRSFGESEL